MWNTSGDFGWHDVDTNSRENLPGDSKIITWDRNVDTGISSNDKTVFSYVIKEMD